MNKAFKSLVVILALGGVMVSTSCKKNTVNGRVKSQTDVATANGQTSTVTTNYSYDNQGRQTLAQPSVGNSTVTVYGNGSVTQTTGSTVVTYQLNSSGLAISDNSGGTYQYDNNGYEISETHGPNSSTTFTILNGNVSNESLVNNGNTVTGNFSYLTTTDYMDLGIKFLGKRNVNLVNTLLISQGGNTTQYTFAYTFDDKGRVLQSTRTGNNLTYQISYTYED